MSGTGTTDLTESGGALPEMAASLLGYWQHFNALGDRPTRDDFTPFSLQKWLGHLDVYGVEDEGETFRIRLNGTKVTENTREDWTGCTAKDVDRKFGTSLQQEVMDVVRSKKPAFQETRIFQKEFATAYRLMLPIFSREGDGKVVQVFLAIF